LYLTEYGDNDDDNYVLYELFQWEVQGYIRPVIARATGEPGLSGFGLLLLLLVLVVVLVVGPISTAAM
jgi:hypothetical protein